MALTIKEIDGAKPTDKPYKLADGGGLCLLVPPSGAKLWRWRYRFDGKEKMMALGEYPLVSLKEARERHAEARKALASGTDPMAERKAEGEAKQKEAEARQREAENSFENVAREWWKWWKIGKSPRHADTTMRRMEADVFPAYGHKSINEVTASDVRQLDDRGREAGCQGRCQTYPRDDIADFSLCGRPRHCYSQPGGGFQAEGYFGGSPD